MALNITPKIACRGGRNIMAWGCFSAYSTGKLLITEGRMNGKMYILDKKKIPSTRVTKQGWTFQQDNDPKHTAKETVNQFQRKKIKLLEWPNQSLNRKMYLKSSLKSPTEPSRFEGRLLGRMDQNHT